MQWICQRRREEEDIAGCERMGEKGKRKEEEREEERMETNGIG